VTGIAASETRAGRGASFVVAAIGCAFAGMCYSELASMIPVAGSGILMRMRHGRVYCVDHRLDLVLEYAVAAAMVAVSWSSMWFFFA